MDVTKLKSIFDSEIPYIKGLLEGIKLSIESYPALNTSKLNNVLNDIIYKISEWEEIKIQLNDNEITVKDWNVKTIQEKMIKDSYIIFPDITIRDRAKMLGIDERTFYRYLDKFKIKNKK